VTLNDYDRNRLKYIVDQNNNMEKQKTLLSALEKWNDLQNSGNIIV